MNTCFTVDIRSLISFFISNGQFSKQMLKQYKSVQSWLTFQCPNLLFDWTIHEVTILWMDLVSILFSL